MALARITKGESTGLGRPTSSLLIEELAQRLLTCEPLLTSAGAPEPLHFMEAGITGTERIWLDCAESTGSTDP